MLKAFRIAVLVLFAGSVHAGQEPCPDPLPPPWNLAQEYPTKRAPGVFDFLILIPVSHPSQLPGDIDDCRIVVGDPAAPVAQIIIAQPDPGSCWREDVSTLTWREPLTMWCSSVDATPGPVAIGKARFKIQGKPPELLGG